MDFLDPAKKKAHGIRLAIGYILIGAAIAVVALILLLQSYGYDINRRTGQIFQNGLVFVAARPDGADIFINGQDKGGTDARFSLPAGQYSFELKKGGYRSWKRTFGLEGGSLERLTYPFLFPEKLNTKDVHLYSAGPTFATNSPDRRWILVQQPGSLTNFDVFDSGQTDPNPDTIALPDDLLTKPDGPANLSLAEWSNDNRHVLLKHDYGSNAEFIILDREQPAQSVNINRQFNINPTRATLRDKKYDQLYFYDEKTQELSSGELKNNQVQPVLSKVIDYKSYGSDTILFIGDDGSQPGRVQLKLKEKEKVTTIRSLTGGTSYILDIARYSDNWYVAAGAASEGIISIYQNPTSAAKDSNNLPVPKSSLKMDQAAYISFSASTQFISVQNGHKFAVYDVEKDRRYYYELPFALDRSYKAQWMDSHHIVVANQNQTAVFDYDGINLQTLTANNSGIYPFFNQDYNAIYNIAPSVTVPGRAALARTPLKANQ
jgi:hypothetical protein